MVTVHFYTPEWAMQHFRLTAMVTMRSCSYTRGERYIAKTLQISRPQGSDLFSQTNASLVQIRRIKG